MHTHPRVLPSKTYIPVLRKTISRIVKISTGNLIALLVQLLQEGQELAPNAAPVTTNKLANKTAKITIIFISSFSLHF